MKRMSKSEAIEAGLSVISVDGEASVQDLKIQAVMVDCGFTMGEGMADAVFAKVKKSIKLNQAPMIPILPCSKFATKYPECNEWNFENEQAVKPAKVIKLPAEAKPVAKSTPKKDTKSEVKEAIDAMHEIKDEKSTNADSYAAVTTTNKSNNKEDITMSTASRNEKKMDWSKVPANTTTNNEEDKNMNANVIENANEVKEVVAEGVSALKSLAESYGVTKDDVKAAAPAKINVPTSGGLKKLRTGAAGIGRTRNPFWYRDFEGIDLSKGEVVEYENAGNLKYIVTMDEAMYGVSRILIFATRSTNANALCDIAVEMDNGLLLKGFKVWNSKDNDGSISLLAPRYSYNKKDKDGNDEVAYSSHVDFRDKEGKMSAPGFVAVILACVDCIFSDVSDDEEE